MNINIFYLAKPKYGGWPTFRAHLYEAFRLQGHLPILYKIGKRTETHLRDFGQGIKYRNLNINDACYIAQANAIIPALDKNCHAAAMTLSGQKLIYLMQDPTEVNANTISLMKQPTVKTVVTRKPNIKNLNKHGIEPYWIKHPYVRSFNGCKKPNPHTLKKAVSYSRLDWDKHTEIIVEANKELEASEVVTIYGNENRLFTHETLAVIDWKWRRNYCGTFKPTFNAGAFLTEKYDYAVDMSDIKGDGGGAQYTFLEAFDTQTPLILNRNWLKASDAYTEGEDVLAVESASELKEILTSGTDHRKVGREGEKNLVKYDPKTITDAYLELING